MRAPGSDHGLLDHCRGILGDFEALLLSCQQNDPPRVTEYERRAHILMIEGVFQGEHGWLVPPDELRDFVVKLCETVGERIVASKSEHPTLDKSPHPGSSVPRFDHTVAGDRGAWVDAQDPHVIPSPPPSPRRRCRSWKRPSRRHPSPRGLP